MKKSSRLGFLLSALIMSSLLSSAYLVSATAISSTAADNLRSNQPSPNEQVMATDPNAEKPLTNIMVNSIEPPFSSEIGPQGSTGSGWKPDVDIVPGSIYTAEDDINPSIATYINASTGAVTLWAAFQTWSGYYSHWFLWVFASNDRGATWWQRGAAEFMSNRSIINPSIAVSPYNGTVFVAVQYAAYGTDYTNDIAIHVISPVAYGDWREYNIDASADDDRSPQLVTEYGFGSSNYLYVVYENWTSTNNRDLRVGRSTNWGQTWLTQTLRGGGSDSTTYAQATIAYVQGNVYIAYRHSNGYYEDGQIDVSYSTNYGGSYVHLENVTSVAEDASWPSITGSHIGTWHKPAAVIVAYEYNTTLTNHDILYAWSTDYGATWTGGNGYFNQIAASASDEFMPRLSVDGMGTENTNVGGNFHLVYRIGNALYYTQRQYWDIPVMLGPTPWANYLGWSSPHGLITDSSAYCSNAYMIPAITTFTKTVGSAVLWEPGVAWTDLRASSYYDLYYTTPGTDFSITLAPSSQTVVSGTATYYSLTVNLVSGSTTPAYLSGTNWPWVLLGTNFAIADYSASPINPTATSTLTLTTSNLMPAGDYYFNATATVGGYRRIVAVPFTVINPPNLEILGLTTWYWTGNTTINSVAVGDVDADGQKETVTGGYFNDGTRNVAQLVVWDSSSLSPERLTTWYWTGNTVINSVAIGDVDGDGQVEIVTGGYYFDGTRNVAQLVVWTGSSLAVDRLTSWYWTSNTVINSVAIGDVDADGQTEIVTGGYFNDGARNRAQLVVWTGSTLAVKRLTDWYWTGNTVINSVAIGNVDADAQVEIVTGGCYFDGTRNVAQLVVWTGSSLAVDRLTSWYWTSNTAINSVAVGDVDADGQTEIVTGGYFNNGAGNVAQLVVWSGSTLTVARVFCVGKNVINSVAVGDVEGDGQVEVVTGGYYEDGTQKEAQLIVWSGSSLAVEDSRAWYWVSDTVINSVCIGDVRGDASKEILTGGAYYDGTRLVAQLIVWGV